MCKVLTERHHSWGDEMLCVQGLNGESFALQELEEVLRKELLQKQRELEAAVAQKGQRMEGDIAAVEDEVLERIERKEREATLRIEAMEAEVRSGCFAVFSWFRTPP